MAWVRGVGWRLTRLRIACVYLAGKRVARMATEGAGVLRVMCPPRGIQAGGAWRVPLAAVGGQ